MPKAEKIRTKSSVDNSSETLHRILDSIRPALARDGGSLELIKYDQKNQIVEVSFTGACAHCPISEVTLKNLIEAEIRAQMPEVKEVRAS